MPKYTGFTQAVFATDSGSDGRIEFGSKAAGSPVPTIDPADIQTTAYEEGWAAATIAGTRFLPTYEDMNGVLFNITYQLAYLQQNGIPEYLATTEYYATSIVREPGTLNLYSSLTNANLGNPLTDVVNWQYAGSLTGLTLPAGAIMAFGVNTPPTGWLECNGSAISRTTYARLFAAISTTFGSGDGSTTFNLPDLRGYFVRGWSHGASIDSGRVFGTTQTDAVQNATGEVGGVRNDGSSIPPSGVFAAGTTAGNFDGGGGQFSNVSMDLSRQIRTASETRPINLALMYCIKY